MEDDELAGTDAIGETLSWIQARTMGDPDKMSDLLRGRGIDPDAFAEAGGVMLAVATAMSQDPETAVMSAFLTGGLLGAMLGREL